MKSVDAGFAAAALLAVVLMAGPAWAGPRTSQGAGSPLVRLAQQDPGDDQGDAAAATVLRLGRLEEQVRTLTGQVEQLQYRNQKLEESLRKMQADTDFRFQDLQRGGAGGAGAAPAVRSVAPVVPKRTDAGQDAVPADALPAESTAAIPPATDLRPVPTTRATGDAFDPAANPDAPGAPRPLGTTAPSPPLTSRPARSVASADSHAPLDLMRPRAGAAAPDVPADAPAVIAAPPVARDANAVASLAPGGTRDEYDADLGLYKQGQYEGAATGFAAFADKYPKDRLVPEAVYLAGESYARLGRHREAAEQFLKVSTDYGKSSRAPDALLKLGMSLNALGAKEQACATYQEVTRRYPAASPDVRAAVDRELKRARCLGNG